MARPTSVAIIQGRMTSQRLPGKTMADIRGKPMFLHSVRRAEAAGVFDEVIMATSDDATDDPIAAACDANGVRCFRGSLNDVLGRYHGAALAAGADIVTRLTADCPLLDPDVIRAVVTALDTDTNDYVSNVLRRTYPKGLDTETFTMAALAKAHEEAMLPPEREHVTPYIHAHPELFRTGHVTREPDLSRLWWTVDEPRDLEFARAVFAGIGRDIFGLEDVLDFLRRHPDIATINTRPSV